MNTTGAEVRSKKKEYAQPSAPAQTSSKRKKQSTRTGPHAKKVKFASPVNTAESVSTVGQSSDTVDDLPSPSQDKDNLIIISEDQYEASPLSMKLPNIISWYAIIENNLPWILITRADMNEYRFQGFFNVLKVATREDLEDMHVVGIKKYSDPLAAFNGNVIIMDYLNIMFLLEKSFSLSDGMYSPIAKWLLFESCGVYCLEKKNGSLEFYLVEKNYKHGMMKMSEMLNVRVTVFSQPTPKMAYDLLDKIFEQMREMEN